MPNCPNLPNLGCPQNFDQSFLDHVNSIKDVAESGLSPEIYTDIFLNRTVVGGLGGANFQYLNPTTSSIDVSNEIAAQNIPDCYDNVILKVNFHADLSASDIVTPGRHIVRILASSQQALVDVEDDSVEVCLARVDVGNSGAHTSQSSDHSSGIFILPRTAPIIYFRIPRITLAGGDPNEIEEWTGEIEGIFLIGAI